MYPGKAVDSVIPWAQFFVSSVLGLYLGLLVGITTENLVFALLAGMLGAFLAGAYYMREGSVYHRLDVLQRALGPDHYRFDISMEWPIDGLMQFVIDRLTAKGFRVFPIASQFVGIPKEALAHIRYGYVIGPINKQLLVLQTMYPGPVSFPTQAAMKLCYLIVVRPFTKGTPPEEDAVVRTVGQILWEFELLRWRKGFPPTVPLRWLGSR